ncbi:MAG TPA: hypothetical protein VJ885_18400 [Thermoanaerobaculia bacterium]|nr:hypothetical protein [Thermoanaerobaculia bacterium]
MKNREQEIAQQVIARLAAYGKLGLLIEDAPDAELRTARELYGSDGLPPWWLCFDNLEDAPIAVERALRAVRPGGQKWARGLLLLVVLDRYLREGKHSPRTVAWDDPESETGKPLATAVRKLRQHCEKSAAGVVVGVTSYFDPAGSSPVGAGALAWKARHHEPLFQLRQTLLADGLVTLLEFGPARNAPARFESRPPAGLTSGEWDAAACRARWWSPCLEGLAQAMRQSDRDCPRILLTGAGLSLANAPLAPGIPPTWFLLDWASWKVLRDRRERHLPPEPVWPRLEEAVSGRRLSRSRIRSLPELIDRFKDNRSAQSYDWSLEMLLENRAENREMLGDFIQAFRQALQKWDHGFPYHVWLLAQLPWSLIITTNFDCFQERAAASAVAGGSGVADRIRRQGDLLKLMRGGTASWGNDMDAILAGAGLFKPYGSLMTMGPLAFSSEDFWKHAEPIQECLQKALGSPTKKEGWLVIIGHRLADSALVQNLMRLSPEEEARLRVVWIDPQGCSLAHENSEAIFRRFDRTALDRNQEALPAGGQLFCPLPARALDFAYDLWHTVRRQEERGR